jgi:hypothetical protein
VFSVLILGAASCSQKSPPASEPTAKPSASNPEKTSASVREQIARTYGLDGFGQVEAIRYTFNAQFPGVNVSRAWVWEPKTGRVSYEGKDKDGKPVKATYIRSQLNNQPENVKNEIDPGFVNDNYWLLFPLHAYWDSSANVQDKGTQPLPQGNGSADLVSVKYPSDGGYTPGDTWDLLSGRTTVSSSSSTIVEDPRSQVSLSQRGRATRKLAHSLSRRTTTVRRMETRCGYSFPMLRLK